MCRKGAWAELTAMVTDSGFILKAGCMDFLYKSYKAICMIFFIAIMANNEKK